MLIISFFTFVTFASSQEILIHVKHGPIRGHVLQIGEHAIHSFKNIPYAKPPVGNLRFELPEEHEGWFSEKDLHENTKIFCPQNTFYEDNFLTDNVLGQEDCLVLDIYLRKNHDTENVSLPVLVYFHGGHFSHGGKEDYGPDYLLRYNDVVLVVPNYRLGILGFLSLQDSVLPGNLGIWDQNAALKWISENIDRFGGDPQRVTIAGHEAGGVSVGLHILVPASHEYFQGAVSDSGTPLSPWLTDTDPTQTTAHKVANAMKCPTVSTDELLLCLKNVSLNEILKVQGRIKNAVFLPTIDKCAEVPLIPLPPKVLYQKGYQKNVNYLIGFTQSEAYYEVSKEFPKVVKYQHLDKMIQHFLKPHFKDTLNFEMIAKAAKYHYLRGIEIPTFESIEPQMVKMMTDFLYRSPVGVVANFHQQKTDGGTFVYMHKTSSGNHCGFEYRRCYGSEFYLFNTAHVRDMFDSHPEIEKEIKTLSKTWGNFIEFGYPDSHRKWKPFTDASELHYAEISDTIQPKFNYKSDDSEFWISLVSELTAAQNATEEPSDTPHTSEYSILGIRGATALAVLFAILCIALMGAVVITKRKKLIMSVLPTSSPKDFMLIGN